MCVCVCVNHLCVCACLCACVCQAGCAVVHFHTTRVFVSGFLIPLLAIMYVSTEQHTSKHTRTATPREPRQLLGQVVRLWYETRLPALRSVRTHWPCLLVILAYKANAASHEAYKHQSSKRESQPKRLYFYLGLRTPLLLPLQRWSSPACSHGLAHIGPWHLNQCSPEGSPATRLCPSCDPKGFSLPC